MNISHPFLNRLATPLLHGIGTLLITAMLAQLSYALLQWRTATVVLPDPSVSTALPTAGPGTTGSAATTIPINGRNLFKPFTLANRPGTQNRQQSPNPLKGLTLTGTIHHSDPNRSRAIFADATKKQQLYGIGQLINGARLTAITEDSARFTWHGQTYTLSVAHNSGSYIPPPQPAAREEDSITVSRAIVSSIIANAGKLLPSLRITPYRKNGSTAGFKVSRVANNSIFHRYGIRNNDIITSVNGVPLTDARIALEQYERLQNARQVTLAILRHGRPHRLRYEIQ